MRKSTLDEISVPPSLAERLLQRPGGLLAIVAALMALVYTGMIALAAMFPGFPAPSGGVLMIAFLVVVVVLVVRDVKRRAGATPRPAAIVDPPTLRSPAQETEVPR